MSKEAFRKKFDRLIDIIWTIQRRIHELEEFERQWQQVFVRLKEKTDTDCKVRILNWDVYRSFRWDKYHIIISDLLSALENEFEYEGSVCRQSLHYLIVHPFEYYVDRTRKVNFIYSPGFPTSEEDQQRHEREMQDDNGRSLRKQCGNALQSLFTNIGEAVQPSSSDLKELTERLRDLSRRIYSARQVFAHKHQERIIQKHTAGLDHANLEQIKTILSEFFKIVKNIGFIIYQTSYGDMDENQKRHIEDQIDLILFGSISSIHLRFFQVSPPETRYRDARTKYYDSGNFTSIVAKE